MGARRGGPCHGAHDAGGLEALSAFEQQYQLLEQVPALSASSPVMAISLPRTWISTPLNADSTTRSNSSRPRRSAMRWLPGTEILTWVVATRARVGHMAAMWRGRTEVRPSVTSRRCLRLQIPALVGPTDGGWAARLQRWAAEARVSARPRPGPGSTGCAGRPRRRAPWRECWPTWPRAPCGCTSAPAGRTQGGCGPSGPTSWP